MFFLTDLAPVSASSSTSLKKVLPEGKENVTPVQHSSKKQKKSVRLQETVDVQENSGEVSYIE